MISQLYNENGDTVTDSSSILGLIANIYENVYTSRNPDEQKVRDYIDNIHVENVLNEQHVWDNFGRSKIDKAKAYKRRRPDTSSR